MQKNSPVSRPDKIRRLILETAEVSGEDLAAQIAKKFQVSRQAVNKHIAKLVDEGLLHATGKTRGRKYTPKAVEKASFDIPLVPKPQEDIVWREKIAPLLVGYSENVIGIWHYGFTEMLNNAIDHSGGKSVSVVLREGALSHLMSISDDGEGIFNKIARELNLYDNRQALLELSKGKLTTDPANHSGEGIFFTSRMFDGFDILAGGLFFTHQQRDKDDWLIEAQPGGAGTTVYLKLAKDATRDMTAVFTEYANTETNGGFRFDKTVVPVRLAKHEGEALVSRSQAKRLVARFENFKTVLLDFTDVKAIGQGFADEIFRVFANAHPEVEILPIRAGEDVMRMIFRVRENTNSPQLDLSIGK